MNRITKEQDQEIGNYYMNPMQFALYKNLLSAQTRYPSLTKKQYRLFLQILEEVKKNKKSAWPKKTP